jgi:hypothetical protein
VGQERKPTIATVLEQTRQRILDEIAGKGLPASVYYTLREAAQAIDLSLRAIDASGYGNHLGPQNATGGSTT